MALKEAATEQATEKAPGEPVSLRVRAALVRTAVIAGFLAIWEFVAVVGWVDTTFVSSPAGVVKALWDFVDDSRVGSALWYTLTSVVAAFVIATVAGVLVGVAIGISESLRRAYLGPILYILSTPKVIYLPIFILLFGIGQLTGILFGAFQAFFYIVPNVVGGVQLVEKKYYTVARAYQAGRTARFIEVILPAALPGIIAALWHGISHALGGVLVKELFISTEGVGSLVRRYTNTFQAGHVIALILLVSIVAIALGALWNRFEVRTSRWRDLGVGATIR